MSSKASGRVNLSIVLLALSLGACGGGASNDDIRRQQAECTNGIAASCALLGQATPGTGAGAESVVTSTNAAASIKFVSANTTNIALKGTGGFGRQEYSTLKFQVFDSAGIPVVGAQVEFVFSDSNTAQTLGGLTLLPASATSDRSGNIVTVVSAGTMPTSVRVVAKIGTAITALSNILVVSTGVPDQKHFSLATAVGNCEGWNIDQDCSIVTATLGDHFGNPAPDGTAVNFTAEGGVIGASCVTGSLPPPGAAPIGQTTNSKVGPGSGTCSVLLRASNPRPANGRVTVLAYALGEEDFIDANGNNVCDNCSNTSGPEFSPADDKSPDISRDDNEDGIWNPGESCVGSNQNGNCSTPGDGKYNGVLRSLGAQELPSAQTSYVRAQLVQTFSGSHAFVTFNPSALVCPAGGTADVQVTVRDENGNIMPAGTSIDFSTAFGGGVVGAVTPASIKVPNLVLAVGQPMVIPVNTVTVSCPTPAASGQFLVTVTTPTTATITTASAPIN